MRRLMAWLMVAVMAMAGSALGQGGAGDIGHRHANGDTSIVSVISRTPDSLMVMVATKSPSGKAKGLRVQDVVVERDGAALAVEDVEELSVPNGTGESGVLKLTWSGLRPALKSSEMIAVRWKGKGDAFSCRVQAGRLGPIATFPKMDRQALAAREEAVPASTPVSESLEEQVKQVLANWAPEPTLEEKRKALLVKGGKRMLAKGATEKWMFHDETALIAMVPLSADSRDVVIGVQGVTLEGRSGVMAERDLQVRLNGRLLAGGSLLSEKVEASAGDDGLRDMQVVKHWTLDAPYVDGDKFVVELRSELMTVQWEITGREMATSTTDAMERMERAR